MFGHSNQTDTLQSVQSHFDTPFSVCIQTDILYSVWIILLVLIGFKHVAYDLENKIMTSILILFDFHNIYLYLNINIFRSVIIIICIYGTP